MNFKTILFIVGFGIMGCSSENNKIQDEISILMAKEQSLSPSERYKLHNLYASYAKKFPKDSLSQGYLANSVVYFEVVGANDTAIQLGKLYLDRYSDSMDSQSDKAIVEMQRNIYISLAKSYQRKQVFDSSITFWESAFVVRNLENSELFKLKDAYLGVLTNKSSPKMEESWIKAATLEAELGMKDVAVNRLDSFVKVFPKSFNAPIALMKVATIYEDNGQVQEAKNTLMVLIDSYPESNWAKEAAFMIEKDMIGKTDDEKFRIATKGKNIQ